MTHRPNILIAGVGNIFLGDDAFGVEVVRRLASVSFPNNIRVVDFGIRGLDLTYALLERWDVVIIIDIAPRGEKPGTVYVIEPGAEPEEVGGISLDMHGLDPAKVLRLVRQMGGTLRRVLVVGCEPAAKDCYEEMELTMSPAVEMGVAQAVPLVESLVTKIMAEWGSAERPSGDICKLTGEDSNEHQATIV